ncbi:MAG: hypothetical protein CVU38_08580 [Chloroflexi bacterium HGW-Chloroflexi-1]|nr:MAG: hypothetical protein CVU38_08580 [Chloroflexi bacterium HGW-Chloroflexi-1]
MTYEIPVSVQTQVAEIMQQFNEGAFRNSKCRYVPRFEGAYLYLDRHDQGRVDPICRLRWTGDMQRWEFEIYKYSSECYELDEGFFPESSLVDGTVEGAMRAGLQAYPI